MSGFAVEGGGKMAAVPSMHPPHGIPDEIPADEWAVCCGLAAAYRRGIRLAGRIGTRADAEKVNDEATQQSIDR